MLIGALVVSLLVLVPEQTPLAFGAETGTVGLTLAVLIARSTPPLARVRRLYPKNFALKVTFDIVTLPPYFLAAATAGNVTTRLGWLAVAVLASIMSAAVSAWVLLVEINRDRPRRPQRN